MGDIIVVFSVVFLLFCMILISVVTIKKIFSITTVYEYEGAVKYYKGRLIGLLKPGQYWYLSHNTHIVKIDIRPTLMTISGQEILTQDGIPIKVSLVGEYEIIDPLTLINKSDNYVHTLYTKLQLVLRDIISMKPVDEVLSERNNLKEELYNRIFKEAEEIGISLRSIDIKDISLGGELKKTFMKVVQAKKEALAQLERARGEVAVLRSLANSAKMIENNPALLQLRILQALGEAPGNTVMLNVANDLLNTQMKNHVDQE